MDTQKNAFLNYEANAWFNRNKDYILKFDSQTDAVISLLRDYQITKGNVLEIGCSAGHRLNGISSLSDKINVFGVDPSADAIAFGSEKFKQIHFKQGTADKLDFPDNFFDVVVIGFVLYVIDRALIYRVVAEVDRVLKNGGTLVIIDFFSESAIKNSYQYITEFEAYSFKQNYEEIFTASHIYHLLDKSTRSHLDKSKDATDDYYNKYYVSLLKKDLEIAYKVSGKV